MGTYIYGYFTPDYIIYFMPNLNLKYSISAANCIIQMSVSSTTGDATTTRYCRKVNATDICQCCHSLVNYELLIPNGKLIIDLRLEEKKVSTEYIMISSTCQIKIILEYF